MVARLTTLVNIFHIIILDTYQHVIISFSFEKKAMTICCTWCTLVCISHIMFLINNANITIKSEICGVQAIHKTLFANVTSLKKGDTFIHVYISSIFLPYQSLLFSNIYLFHAIL